jgi:hypothetical protein
VAISAAGTLVPPWLQGNPNAVVGADGSVRILHKTVRDREKGRAVAVARPPRDKDDDALLASPRDPGSGNGPHRAKSGAGSATPAAEWESAMGLSLAAYDGEDPDDPSGGGTTINPDSVDLYGAPEGFASNDSATTGGYRPMPLQQVHYPHINEPYPVDMNLLRRGCQTAGSLTSPADLALYQRYTAMARAAGLATSTTAPDGSADGSGEHAAAGVGAGVTGVNFAASEPNPAAAATRVHIVTARDQIELFLRTVSGHTAPGDDPEAVRRWQWQAASGMPLGNTTSTSTAPAAASAASAAEDSYSMVVLPHNAGFGPYAGSSVPRSRPAATLVQGALRAGEEERHASYAAYLGAPLLAAPVEPVRCLVVGDVDYCLA